MDTYTAWANVPDNLKTKTQMAKLGKRPARGQKPAAQFESFYHGKRRPKYYDLYDLNEAVDKTLPTPDQLERLAKGRETAAENRRCPRCQRKYNRHNPKIGGQCERCHDEQSASKWARMALDSHRTIVLDTETTGLGGDAQIVEIAIVSTQGETLLNTLVRPTCPIPPEASAIHGITDADVRDAPLWPEVWQQVLGVFEQARVVTVWNLDFDVRLMEQSCLAYGIDYGADLDALSTRPAAVCAMNKHAAWFGEPHRDGGYRWQALNGGHRARGDCLAVIERLKEMAK